MTESGTEPERARQSSSTLPLPHTVLFTGARGRVGHHILTPLRERYREVRTFDRQEIPGDPLAITGELTNLAALQSAMRGVDTLIHFAAQSDEAPFVENLVPSNVVGVYNAFEAAAQSGTVKRILFASTVQAVGGYPREHKIEITDLPRPVTLYGATKILGETMGRWYFDKRGIEFVGIRIGWFQDYDSPDLQANRRGRNLWLSPRDCASLVMRAIEKKDVGYALVFATSRTEQERLSLTAARESLDWEPQDDFTALIPPPAPGE
ncbi:MAG: NAD(P)-dependent oxidoreductase [Cytophagales bacterium]|nr:NAD(P)-dependent oxidoreductase [Armatimonadota bacterium]